MRSRPVLDFPDSSVAFLTKHGRKQVYQTPDGLMDRCTTVTHALPKDLTDWAAKLERETVIAVAQELIADGFDDGPASFRLEIEKRLGPARAHQQALAKGAELGTFAHQEIQRQTHGMLGLPVGPQPEILDQSMLAVMAWEEWFQTSGLTPVRCEQVVWDTKSKVAGTVDLLAVDANGDLGVVDYKTSKWIYDEHHVQVAKYVQMAGNFASVKWAKIVRLPKTLDDRLFAQGKAIEVVDLGVMYEKQRTLEELLQIFDAAQVVHRLLISREAA